jgi:hypothetical protein
MNWVFHQAAIEASAWTKIKPDQRKRLLLRLDDLAVTEL